jgi:hypothetical protein
LAALPDVPITVAPIALAACRARHAHARGDAGHQQRLAGAQPALQHQHVVHHHEGERDRAGVRPVERWGHCNRLALIEQCAFGECAGATPHRAVADAPAVDTGPDRQHLAGRFGAHRLGAAAARVQAMAGDEFAAVQARGAHADQQLTGTGLGLRHIAQLQLRAAVGIVHAIGAHRVFTVLRRQAGTPACARWACGSRCASARRGQRSELAHIGHRAQ